MNKVILTGYLTKDPNLSYYGDDNKPMARFTLAVNRTFKNSDGKRQADFIGCVVYGKRAETIEKYFSKGNAITVEGEWRTGNYKDKDGNTVYTNECQVGNFEFPISAKSEKSDETPKQETKSNDPEETTHNRPSANTAADDDYMDVPDDDLPFFG